MNTQQTATVRVIAMLHGYCTRNGMPVRRDVSIPDDGLTAESLARQLELPLDMVEGVFLDHRAAGLDAVVHPGSRVTFVPKGTPASHPAFFGSFKTR